MRNTPELVEEVLETAGGADRWRRAQRITARVRSGGLLPRTRMPGNKLSEYTLTVETSRQHAVLDPFPKPGLRGVFDGSRVRLETDSGELVEERLNPRDKFSGLSGLRRNLRWDALDGTFFAGYAMWSYMTMPLLLGRPEVTVAEGASWSGEGARWRRLDVRYSGLETHSPAESFFFDDSGLQTRHDYTATVVAPVAHAAHYTRAHREFDGLMFPTERQVLPRRRNLRSRPFPTLVSLEILDVSVDFRP